MALWFTLHVLFEDVERAQLLPGIAPLLPHMAGFDPISAGLCALALLCALWLRWGTLTLMSAAIAAGLAVTALGLV